MRVGEVRVREKREEEEIVKAKMREFVCKGEGR